jgi:hypothetical protein
VLYYPAVTLHVLAEQKDNAMKVLVAVKRVVDAYVKIRVASDGSGVETANTKSR